MNRILIDDADVVSQNTDDDIVHLSDQRAQHLHRVLRIKPGETVKVARINGPLGTGTVLEATRPHRIVMCCRWNAVEPPRPKTTLLLAMPRPKIMKRLWAQLAALGVRRIILTNAAKVERNYFDTHVLNPEFYRPLLIEGLTQAACDAWIPDVIVTRRLKVFLEDQLDDLLPTAPRYILHPYANQSLTEMIARASTATATVAIGPEGGWTDFELDLFSQHNFIPCCHSSRILRTDTACISILSAFAAPAATQP
ncbi:MAG: 16S rRNA (uracil(1498)-N(3))-methyltransferase [Spartobacteria bacterium]|nr:16S rRNA (uracil(1498)-N(3))-methyltransferase [Spartobacteria bacterium]